MRTRLLSIALCLAATVASAAAGVWETKPFTMWSDKELEEILNDSPWSRKVNVVLNAGPRVSDDLGGGGRGGGGGGAGEGEGGGRGGGRGFPVAPPQLKLVISWRTALPMKQAIVRSQIGLAGAVPEETQQVLDRSEVQYIVAISGLPVRYGRLLAGMKGETFLKRGSKPPIVVEGIEVQQTDTTLIVFFGFPRSEAIRVEDKEVEFVTKLGTWDIKKKFALKDMVFHGTLEL